MKTINRFSEDVLSVARKMLKSCDYVGVADADRPAGGGDIVVGGVCLTKMSDEVCYSTLIAKRGFDRGLSFAGTPRDEVEVQYV